MPVAQAPDDVVRTPAEAAANERPPLLVLEPLRAFLDEHRLGTGELGVEPLGEGHSNVTYLVRRGGRDLVVRRPPRPPEPGVPPPAAPAAPRPPPPRRGHRCRRARTTCCARRGCCARSATPT